MKRYIAIGTLNLMTPESRAAVLGRVRGGAAYDLAVEYFVGRPSWQGAGDPHYVPIIELAKLEELSRDKVYEFALIGPSLELRGADAAPLRPIALPLGT